MEQFIYENLPAFCAGMAVAVILFVPKKKSTWEKIYKMELTQEYILNELKKFARIHKDYGLIISERNAERFAEDLLKNCSILDVDGQIKQLVCDVCEEPVKVNKAGNLIICNECGYIKEAN